MYAQATSFDISSFLNNGKNVLSYRFAGTVGMASKILNKLDQLLVYRNLYAKFSASSFYDSWDLDVQPDGLTEGHW